MVEVNYSVWDFIFYFGTDISDRVSHPDFFISVLGLEKDCLESLWNILGRNFVFEKRIVGIDLKLIPTFLILLKKAISFEVVEGIYFWDRGKLATVSFLDSGILIKTFLFRIVSIEEIEITANRIFRIWTLSYLT